MNVFRRLRDEEEGLSMAELLVTMVIGTVLLTLIASLFLTTTQATARANQTRDAATVAGNIANAVTTGIRFATRNAVAGSASADPAVVEATASSVTVFTLLDSGTGALSPTRIRYSVRGSDWVEDRWAGSTSGGFTTFPSAATSSRVLGSGAIPQTLADRQPFLYFDANGAAIAPDAAMAASQRDRIAQVQVTIGIRSAANGPATEIVNTVGMPNLSLIGGVR